MMHYLILFILLMKSLISHPIYLDTWEATVDPFSLHVYGKTPAGHLLLLGHSDHPDFSSPKRIQEEGNAIRILYPEVCVLIFKKKDRLHFLFETEQARSIHWPTCGSDSHVDSLIFPDSEGLYIPVDDPFWMEKLKNYSASTSSTYDNYSFLSMPFFGFSFLGESVGYIFHSDLRNELQFHVKNDRLSNSVVHHGCVLDKKHLYEISIAFTKAAPLGPAWNYKNYLIEENRFKTLAQKRQENPNIEKLYGAPHIYVWGTGRTIALLDHLQKLHIDRLWIGYETELEPNNAQIVDVQFIEEAKKRGYLLGPYDCFCDIMDPEKADCPNVIFENLYPQGAIVQQDGTKLAGFAGRGFYLSSEALAKQKNKPIYERVDRFVKTGINSYFLDCDAFGELLDDYSVDHAMNQEKDRENRLERMAYIAQKQKLVLGSETACAWSIPLLAFSHGNVAVANRCHFQLTKNQEVYGAWWPKGRQDFFFKPVEAPAEYIKSKYDPAYRIPLFQAVFHETIVTTDRWECSHMKFPNILAVRELFELLYGVPSIWSLDLEDAHRYRTHFKKLFATFSPLHKAIAEEPLTSFQWVTKDRQVQEIVYGNKIRLTANFLATPYENIPAYSLRIHWLDSGKQEIYTP